MLDICKYFSLCGGCDFQDKSYPAQLEYKQNYIKNIALYFKTEEILPITASQDIWNYRNKMEFVVSGKPGSVSIGQRQKNNYKGVVDLEDCPIFCREAGKIFLILKDWIQRFSVAVYNLSSHEGILRYVIIRHSKYFNQIMVIIVLSADQEYLESKKGIYDDLVKNLQEVSTVKSIYALFERGVSDSVRAEENVLLWGKDFIQEQINGINYLIDHKVFFQTNSTCCARLYRIIQDELKNLGSQNVLDLYCGSGGISLQIAGYCKKVIGVDNSEQNIRKAKENSKLNKITNVEFICEDAKAYLDKYTRNDFQEKFDTIVVDPPRSGLDKQTKKIILRSQPKNLFYISCNPLSFLQDLKLITSIYQLKKVYPVDMFPHTRHIELVAVLAQAME